MATALQDTRRERLMTALEAAHDGLTTRELADRCAMTTADARRQLQALSEQRMRLRCSPIRQGSRCVLHWRLLA